MNINYEIDWLPIGNSKCGDSFLVRMGYLNSTSPADHTVILIDGGFTDDWKTIRSHVNEWYGHDKVDIIISTHPDQDHINGLAGVIENMTVGALLMHKPWEHSVALAESKDIGFSSARLNKILTKSLSKSANLAEVAERYGVPIVEPFAGETSFNIGYGTVTVVGPSRDYYESILPQFLDWQPKPGKSSNQLAQLQKILASVTNFVDETFNYETLTDKGEVSPSNNSSAIVLIKHGNQKFLFTGDAGMEALELAAIELEYLGHQPGSYNVVQIPHHGSRSNVGPTILDRLLGAKLTVSSSLRGLAYVSAAKDCEDHPKKVVMNAFNRRGYPVISTEGVAKVIHNLGTNRPNWSTSAPHPLYAQVEADD